MVKDISVILRVMRKAVKSPAVVQSKDPFRVLITTVLSQRTRDQNTEKAASQLFAKYKDAEPLSKAPMKDIEKLIKPAGFFKVKAKRLQEISRLIVEKYNGKTPSGLEQLLLLPGVGRKTAACVLLYGFNIACIPCDIHVMIISQRLSLTKEKHPDKIQDDLEAKLPKKYWSEFNHLCVVYGQKICLTRNPKCYICELTKYCDYFKANKAS